MLMHIKLFLFSLSAILPQAILMRIIIEAGEEQVPF